MRDAARAWPLVLLVGLVACGGGGGGTATSGVPGAATGPTQAVATIRIVVPSASSSASVRRRPAYVSAGAQSMSLALYTVAADGTIASTPLSTTDVDLVPSSTCSGTPLACNIALDAPVGVVTFGVTLYAQTGETGAVLATFVPSAVHEFTILANGVNVIGISLDGVPAQLAVTVSPATLTAGTGSTATVTVVAKDASNNVIIGTDPYASPIQLTDGDPTGNTTLSPANVVSPATTASLVYAGGALTGSSFTIGATYPATVPVLGSTTVGVLNPNGVTAVPSTVSFVSAAQPPVEVTYGEAAYTGPLTVVPNGCSGIATITQSSGAFYVAAAGPGGCTVTVSDNANHTATVTIGVTETQVTGS
jgi:hypothetical protein